VRRVIWAAHRTLEHQRVQPSARDVRTEPVSQVDRDRKVSASMAALQRPVSRRSTIAWRLVKSFGVSAFRG
jgi:hypothetical protein